MRERGREPKLMQHDIVFIGHVCLDRLVPYEGEEQVGLGSAVYYGSMAAAQNPIPGFRKAKP